MLIRGNVVTVMCSRQVTLRQARWNIKWTNRRVQQSLRVVAGASFPLRARRSAGWFINARSSHHWRSFCFIYGRLAEVRPQFRMRHRPDNYTLATAEKGRHFILNMDALPYSNRWAVWTPHVFVRGCAQFRFTCFIVSYTPYHTFINIYSLSLRETRLATTGTIPTKKINVEPVKTVPIRIHDLFIFTKHLTSLAPWKGYNLNARLK